MVYEIFQTEENGSALPSVLCFTMFPRQRCINKQTQKQVRSLVSMRGEAHLILLLLAVCAYRNSQSGGGKQSRSRMSMQMKVIVIAWLSPLGCGLLRYCVCVQSASRESLKIQCKCNTQAGRSCEYHLNEGRAQHKMTWMLD